MKSFWDETAGSHRASGQENRRNAVWFSLFGGTLRAHYLFTAQDEQCQITQIYSTAPQSAPVSHPTLGGGKVFSVLRMNSNAPPLVLLSLREVNELTETPSHNVVVYFPSELMQMEGAAKAGYAGEHCFSWFRELYPQLSAFQCSCSLSSVFRCEWCCAVS